MRILYRNIARCLVGASLLVLAACSNDVDNVFGNSASNRMDADQHAYYSILEGSQHGWVLDFYPSDRIEGGVAYTARFKEGQATMACEQDINNTVVSKKFTFGTEVTSAYQVTKETGVMLTFDTYNALFHYWSQPFKGHAKGYESDYEFTFVSATPDAVLLRGKKYGNMLRMYPLQQAATDYVKDVNTMHNTLKAINRKRAVVDGKTYPITMAYNLMVYDAPTGRRSVAFIHTPTGIRFYEPIQMGDYSYSAMTYDKDTQELRTADGRAVLPKPTTLEQLFVTAQSQWLFGYTYSVATKKYTLDGMCDELKDIISRCADVVNGGTWGETVRELYIGANMEDFANDKHRWVLGWQTRMSSIRYNIGYAISMEVADASRQLVSINMTEAANLFSNYGYWQPFVDFVGQNSPYLITFDNDAAPKEATLLSERDATKWFKLKLR